MCTLSILSTPEDQIIFTFNRDESPLREAAPPQLIEDGHEVYLAPIDLESHGTWLGVSESGILAFLMNGGFVKHKRKESYRHSRGLIIPMFFTNGGSQESLDEMDLSEIEPFSMVIYKDKILTHFVWDGARKYWNDLNNTNAHLFSSAPLYNPEDKEKIKGWFESAVKNIDSDHAAKILNLHLNSFQQNGLRYSGNKKVQTVSTSQIVVTVSGAGFDYYDHTSNQKWSDRVTWKKTTH